MIKQTYRAGAMLSAVAVAAACGQSFTAGDLVVSQVGSGTAALSSAATPVTLVEFSTTGVASGFTVALPVAASGSNRICTVGGSASTEGQLTRSVDGQYLVMSGYDTAVGTTSVGTTTSALVNRVVARISANGTIDTTTALTDAFSAASIRGACSIDGTGFWLAGGNGGIRYAPLAATTSTVINTTPTNTRTLNIFANQLYVGAASSGFLGVSTVGAPPPPTTAGNTVTLLPGMPTVAGTWSAYDFFFADANTLYIADDTSVTTANGGIQKWTFDGTTWTMQYILRTGLSIGVRGLTGSVSAGTATLYATTASTSANLLVSVVDGGAASPFSTLATAPTNTVFRGVDWSPAAATPPTGACCIGGSCSVLTSAACASGGGTYSGDGTNCGSVSCSTPCYANCDSSTTPPVLNVLDFSCFLNRFAAGDTFANCDNSTTPPVLNVLDFSCFLNRFAAGCT